MYKISTENIGDVKKYLWHYRKDNKEYGPFTYEDIIELAQKGEIGPDDYVLKFGNKKFIKASEVQGLFDVIVQSEEEKEEHTKMPEGQIEISEEQVTVTKEDTEEELHAVFENRTTHIQAKRKQESFGPKIAMIMAGAAGLGLAVWILTKLL